MSTSISLVICIEHHISMSCFFKISIYLLIFAPWFLVALCLPKAGPGSLCLVAGTACTLLQLVAGDLCFEQTVPERLVGLPLKAYATSLNSTHAFFMNLWVSTE